MDEAGRCDMVALIDGGKILDIDTPQRLEARMDGNLYNASARDMYPLLNALRTFPGVIGCYTFGATLHVVTDCGFDADVAVMALSGMGLADVKIYPAKGDIEDLFIKLAGNG